MVRWKIRSQMGQSIARWNMWAEGTNIWSSTVRVRYRGWRHVQRFESHSRKCEDTCLRLFEDAACRSKDPLALGVISFFREYGPTVRGCKAKSEWGNLRPTCALKSPSSVWCGNSFELRVKLLANIRTRRVCRGICEIIDVRCFVSFNNNLTNMSLPLELGTPRCSVI